MALRLTIIPFDCSATPFASPPAPEYRRVEPCGAGFEHARCVAAKPQSGGAAGGGGKEHHHKHGHGKDGGAKPNRGDTRKTVKLSDEDIGKDWYEVLKLASGEGATDEEIRTAYRRRCLETHPDKQKNKDDTAFKEVQRAFEILSNADARRAYDSSKPFDDSIPAAPAKPWANDAEFFATFGPVFQRNKKWSSVECAVTIGDESTPIKDVRAFYDFWLGFRSWRDFSHEVEMEEIDEGMDRFEKRFYQRENQRRVDALKRDESKRIRSLVDRAMQSDPRLRRAAEAEAAEREAAKRKREDERLRLEMEEAAAKAAAERAAADAEKAKKDAALERKRVQKEQGKRVADFFKDNGLVENVATNHLFPDKVRPPNVTWFAAQSTIDEITACAEAVTAASPVAVDDPASPSGKRVPAVATFNEQLERLERRVGRNRFGEAIAGAAPAVVPTSATAAPAAAAA